MYQRSWGTQGLRVILVVDFLNKPEVDVQFVKKCPVLGSMMMGFLSSMF